MRHPTSQTSNKSGVALGVFSCAQEADEYAASCAQELQDKLGYDCYFCRVEITTYYG